MFKLTTSCGIIKKSYDIYELWEFVISNNYDYTFYLEYSPLSKSAFLKLFLTVTGNWEDYFTLHKSLSKKMTLQEYVDNKEANFF